MAFLAVIREGFETAVFLLAAFQSAASPIQAGIGVVLGVLCAGVLGYLVYRGGVKLNLSRFFRITGAVLVLVAAGLVMSTLRAAYEAGWLTAGQQQALDLSAIARTGSVQESLLTGMLGIRSSLPVVEVIAYLLYAVPMLLVVLWPPRRTPSRLALGRILVGGAAAALAAAGLLVVLAPPAPAPTTGPQGPLPLTGDGGRGGTASVQLDSAPGSGQLTQATLRVEIGGATTVGTTTLTATGHSTVAAGGSSASATSYTGTPINSIVDAVAAGLPTALTADQVAALNGGRLPVGIRSGRAGQMYPASYTDTITPTITADPDAAIVVGLRVHAVRTVQVDVPGRAAVQVGAALDSTLDTPVDAVAPALAQVADFENGRNVHQVVGQVIPGLLVAFAIVLLAFGLPKLVTRRPPSRAPADRAPAKQAQTEVAPVGAGPSAAPVPATADRAAGVDQALARAVPPRGS
jgi:high-affinity iron transporter